MFHGLAPPPPPAKGGGRNPALDMGAAQLHQERAALPPDATGTTTRTHTFQSGNWTLPSLAIETAMPEVPRFAIGT
jgi:hypothetical protein